MAQIDPPADALVGDWLTLPEAADRLGIPPGRLKQLFRDRKLLAVRRPDGTFGDLLVTVDVQVPKHTEGEARDDLWVLHMDDDTGVGPDTAAGLHLDRGRSDCSCRSGRARRSGRS